MTSTDLDGPHSFEFPGGAAVLRLIERQSPSSPGSGFLGDGRSSGPRKARRRVLVVEDEDLYRKALVKTLRNDHGVDVEAEDSAETALARIDAGSMLFDLVITDVSLPGLSGFELHDAIRARDLNVPIVLMSAYREYQATADELDIPFYEKPLSDATLDEMLREHGGGKVS